ncbi:MAG: mevalonate kinase [Promethearchaeota archaeon]
MNKVIAKAPGKCILFGEHSVVYGYPAIAIAIPIFSTCAVEEINEKVIELDLVNFIQKYKFKDLEELININNRALSPIAKCLAIFKERYGVNISGLRISIASDLIPGAGLGSSASIAASLTFAVGTYFGIKLSKKKVSKIAFKLEKITHGTPSGIDNNICTYGNLIYFKKGKVKSLKLPFNLNFLITYTNIKHNTKEAIKKVKEFINNNPKEAKIIMRTIGALVKEVKLLFNLRMKNLSEIGSIMNENQKLLSKLGVSNDTIAEIIDIALDNGAYGAKLTGAGLGGCVITLGEHENLKKIKNILKNKGYESFYADICEKGVHLVE